MPFSNDRRFIERFKDYFYNRNKNDESGESDESTEEPAEEEGERTSENGGLVTKEKFNGALEWPPRYSMSCECTGDEPVEIAIFHEGNAKGARIVRNYVEYAFCEAFGDQYNFNVHVINEPLDFSTYHYVEKNERRSSSSNEFRARLRNELSEYKATGKWSQNHLLRSGSGSGVGGGVTSVSGHADLIADSLSEDTVRQYAGSWAYKEVNVAVHEIGHGFGFNHKEGGTKDFKHKPNVVTPMQTTYADGDVWTVEFNDTVKELGFREF